MLAGALNLAPFKDVFWSSSIQPSNSYNAIEPSPSLQAIVSVLSTGPVALGDKIGHTDSHLVKMMIREDGMILKPSYPATTLDSTIAKRAFSSSSSSSSFSNESEEKPAKKEVGGMGDVVTSSYSSISGWNWGYLLGASIEEEDGMMVTPSMFSFGSEIFGSSSSSLFAYLHMTFSDQDQQSPIKLQHFSEQSPISLPPSSFSRDFTYWVVSPQFSNGLVLLGEIGKIVPISPQRITSISTSTKTDTILTISGAPQEEVVMYYVMEGDVENVRKVSCMINEGGRAKMNLISETCS